MGLGLGTGVRLPVKSAGPDVADAVTAVSDGEALQIDALGVLWGHKDRVGFEVGTRVGVGVGVGVGDGVGVGVGVEVGVEVWVEVRVGFQGPMVRSSLRASKVGMETRC